MGSLWAVKDAPKKDDDENFKKLQKVMNGNNNMKRNVNSKSASRALDS